MSITHFWLIQVISLTNSKDSSKFNQGIMLAKLSLITLNLSHSEANVFECCNQFR